MITVEKIKEISSDLKDLKIGLIGESIIDEYIYVKAIGTASKDPVISTREIEKETFAGGILAVANHLAEFSKNIDLISVLGSKNSKKDFINNKLNKKINKYFFKNNGSETIIKTRFLEEKRLVKLFKMENSDGKMIPSFLEQQILNKLKKTLSNYDIFIVTDFGHGLLTNKIRKYITENANYLCLNVQTNSSNFGFNPLSKYEKADFISLNNRELRMYFQDNEYHKNDLLNKLIQTDRYKKILLTASSEGILYFDSKKTRTHNAFTSRPIDTVGAGDAVFSIGSILSYIGEDQILPEISNIVGAISVETIGNKEPVTKEKIIDFIQKNTKRN